MREIYNHSEIESRWQAKWEKDGIYKVQDSNSKERNKNSVYNLVYGKQFRQTLLAENLHGALHLYDYLDSSFLPKINDPIFRLSKLFFTNYLIVDYMLTMNH